MPNPYDTIPKDQVISISDHAFREETRDRLDRESKPKAKTDKEKREEAAKKKRAEDNQRVIESMRLGKGTNKNA